MNEHVINLVKSLSKGPCSCQYNMGSFSMTWDAKTGECSYSGDRGPRTHHCTRCQAREALEADGVEYVKDDRVQWTMKYAGDGATAAKTFGEGVTVMTGSLVYCPPQV